YLTRGLAIREKATPSHPETVALVVALAEVDLTEGKTAEALARCEHAEALEKKPGADVALCRASALAASGKLEEACKEATRAGELESPGRLEQAQALTALGDCELRRLGRRPQARAALERAVTIVDARGAAVGADGAAARFALARALEGDPARAARLAALAR